MKRVLEEIKSCNVELFKGIRMEARTEKDGVYRVPFFSKELAGESYLLPNYSYYGCPTNDLNCLEGVTKKEFNLFEFAEANKIENQSVALLFTGKYIDSVISEYTRIGVREVLSDSKIGDCVIFYYDKEHYIAFVPDINKVYNDLWKSKFISENKIGNNWYSNLE